MSYLIITKKNYTCAMYVDKITKQDIQQFEKQGFEIKVIK